MPQTATTVSAPTGAATRILPLWRRLSRWPAGSLLFSLLLGRFVRYSGTVGARIIELEPGRCVAVMRDRARVRNHLRSVHATALVTLGELVSGLSLVSALPPRTRAIATSLEIDYLKKARGRLTAHGRAPVPGGDERAEYVVTASITDASGEEVAAMRVRWLVGPEKG